MYYSIIFFMKCHFYPELARAIEMSLDKKTSENAASTASTQLDSALTPSIANTAIFTFSHDSILAAEDQIFVLFVLSGRWNIYIYI